MATTTRRVSDLDIQAVLGAISPEIARTDNKIITLNGHPVNIFDVQTVTTSETDLNLTTRLVRVAGGAVLNTTDNTVLSNVVVPLSTNASVAVVKGNLPADKSYVIYVWGTEV